MLKKLKAAMPISTSKGTVFARFAVVPQKAGDPWWVVYRGDCGRWFTTMLTRRPSLG